MQEITQKQVAEWKEELVRQVQTRDNAQKELNSANININALQGGVQFGENLLKQFAEADQKSGTVELNQQSEKAPSKK